MFQYFAMIWYNLCFGFSEYIVRERERERKRERGSWTCKVVINEILTTEYQTQNSKQKKGKKVNNFNLNNVYYMLNTFLVIINTLLLR